MKRVLSLVLALTLVLGSIPAGFAATETAGETLKGYGLLTGDAAGNLNEDKTIDRASMITVMIRLLGQDTAAKAYAVPATFTDVSTNWAKNYIAYAEKENLTSGVGNGLFAPAGKVTLQQMAKFMMTALGYEVTDYATVVEQAQAKGLLTNVVATDKDAVVLKADVFTSMLNTVNAPLNGSTQKLGEKLGVLKSTAAAVDVKSAEAVSYKVVAVTLNTAVTEVKAADFAITGADAKALEVKGATLINSTTVWLDTADQTAGALYTVAAADKTAKFTGVAKDTTVPALLATSKVVDNVTVKLEFDKELDPRTALVAANYTISNNLQVTKAAFDTDADGEDVTTTVVLTTSAQTLGTLYTTTVATKVTDLAGNAVKSADDANIFKFGGMKADTTLPKLSAALGVNAVKVTLTFTEPSGLDKTTAENVANYTLTNKTDAAKTATITKAELVQDANDVWNTVELTTTAQTVGNVYEIKVANVADKFGNVISTTADYKTTFSGQPADTTGPEVSTVEVKTNVSVKVTFNEKLDEASATTAANYTISNDLTVVKAALDSTKKIVTLTTSSQKSGTAYKVTVANVTDLYANKVSSTKNNGYFSGIAIDETKPSVAGALASVDGSKTYVTVRFDEDMNDTAKVATNYYFGTTVGYGVEVTKIDAATYKVRVNALEDLKNYTVTVSNVEDLTGNVVDSDANTANFVGKSISDNDAPKVVGVVAIDKNTVKVLFSRPVDVTATETAAAGNAAVSNKADDADNYKLVEKGSTTNLITDYTKVLSYAAADEKSVTLRFQTGSGVTLAAGKVYEVYVNGAADATGVTFDAATTSIVADNGVKLAAADSYVTMGSNTTAASTPEVVTAYAVNTSTIHIKFNTAIVYAGAAATDIIFTKKSDNTVVNHVIANTSVSASDDTVLVVKTATALTAGAVYTAKVAVAAAVTDIYGDKTTSTTANTSDFTAPSTANDKPSITGVAVMNSSQLQVTLSEEVSAFNKALFTVTGGTAAVNHVEYKSSTEKNVLNVYFNNTALTAGSVYKLEVAIGGLTDMVGQTNTEKTTADFAATGNTMTKVKISDVVKLADNKVRVMINRPIVDGATTLVAADFSVAGVAGLTIASLDAAYLGSSSKTVTAGAVAAGTYVDSVDLTLSKNVLAGQTATFDIGAGFVAKDSAAVDTGATSKTYAGTVSNTQPTMATTTPGVLATTAQVNTATVNEAAAATQSLTVTFADGNISVDVTVAVTAADTATTVATAIKTALAANTTIATRYTITDAAGVITTTQKAGYEAPVTLTITLK